MTGIGLAARVLGIGCLLTIGLGCSGAGRPGVDSPESAARAAGWQRASLVHPSQVQMRGVLGRCFDDGLARLTRDPFSVPFLLADVNFGMKRWFTNYSGDISGRFLEVAALTSSRTDPQPPALRGVIEQIPKFQRADGHFGADVAWSAPIDFSTSSDQTTVMPILWGNGRLLLGLVAAGERFGDTNLLAAASKLGSFYVNVVVPRFCDPTRMAEYRQEAWYAAAYVTCVFEGMEGLVRLFRVTGNESYLKAAIRMADFHEQFDTLPAGHAHGCLSQHTGLVLLYEETGDAKFLRRATARWTEAVKGGFVNPAGGVLEQFRVTGCDRDEGCAEGDWLRFNLLLWSNTGDTKYLDMAERLLWNHYLANQWPSGGFGHRKIACDEQGPYAFRELHQESLWCCSFHCPLALHDLRSFLSVMSQDSIWYNFPLDYTATLGTGTNAWTISSRSLGTEPGIPAKCELAVTGRGRNLALRIRIPDWCEKVAVRESEKLVKATREGNYLRLEGLLRSESRLEIAYHGRPFLEDRRFRRIALPAELPGRIDNAIIRCGPHVLMNAVDGEKREVVLKVLNGTLQLPGRESRSTLSPFSELENPTGHHSFVFNVGLEAEK